MFGDHGEADQPPRPKIQHYGEVQPALTGGDERDVAGPDQVGVAGREVTAHQIRWRRVGVTAKT